MRYCHFVNNRWTKQKTAAIGALAVLALLISFASLLELITLCVRGKTSFIDLFFPVLSLVAFPLGGANLFWTLRRFEFSEDGLVIRGVFRKRAYPWGAVREYGVFVTRVPWQDSGWTRYYFFILSSPDEVKSLCRFIRRCFYMQRRVVVVRYTEKRESELERILKKKTMHYIWDMNREKYVPDPTSQEDICYRLPKYPTKSDKRWHAIMMRSLAVDDEW